MFGLVILGDVFHVFFKHSGGKEWENLATGSYCIVRAMGGMKH